MKNKDPQEIKREIPYNYCWWCSKLLMRITRGKQKGSYAFTPVRVDNIIRYVHKRCEKNVKEFYGNRVSQC